MKAELESQGWSVKVCEGPGRLLCPSCELNHVRSGSALALITRIGTHVRATRDFDANWRRVQAELEEALDAVIDIDLGDGFEFEIGDATIM